MRRFLLIIALLLAGIAPMQAAAQKETPDESIRLTVGDIFQILAVSDTPNAKYSWILEKNNTFVEAGREKDFRTRIIIPGKYTLRVDESNGNGIVASRLFAVNVVSQDEASSKSANAADGALAVFDPPLGDASVVLDDQSQVVRVAPATNGKALILDLDRQADSDDDGNPADDQDTVDTFLAADGTPLYLWIPHLTGKREMLVREDPPTAAAQQMQIVTTQYAQSNSIVRGQLDIIADQTDGLTVRFSSKFKGTPPKAPLLYRWSFGDGEESLQQNPEHTYSQSGTYTVGLRTLDVRTGEDIAEREEVLTIESGETGTGATASSASSSESSESSSVSSVAGTASSASSSAGPAVPSQGFWSGVGMRAFMIALGVFIVAAIIGAVIVFAMRMLRGGSDSLQARLEKIDSSMKTGGGAPVPMDTATPLKMRKDTDTSEKTERVEKVIETTAQKAPEEPKVDMEKAPSWLKKGLGETDDTASSPPVPDWLKPRPADAGGIPDPAILTEPVASLTVTPAPAPAPAPSVTVINAPAPAPAAPKAPAAPAPVPPRPAPKAPTPPVPPVAAVTPATPVAPAPLPTTPKVTVVNAPVAAPAAPAPIAAAPAAAKAPVAPAPVPPRPAPKAPTPPAAPAAPIAPAPVPPRPAPAAPAVPVAPTAPAPVPTAPAAPKAPVTPAPVPPRPAPKAPTPPAAPAAPAAPVAPVAPAAVATAPAPVPPRPAPKAPIAPAVPAAPAAEPTEKPAPITTPAVKNVVPPTVAVQTPTPAAPAAPKQDAAKPQAPKAPAMPARPAMEKPAKTDAPAPLPQRPAAPAAQKLQTPAPMPAAAKPSPAPKQDTPKPPQPAPAPSAPKAQTPVVPVRPPKEAPKSPAAASTPSAGAFPPALPKQPATPAPAAPKAPVAPIAPKQPAPAPQSPAPAQEIPSDQTIAIVRADSIIKESGEIPRVDEKKPNA